MPDRADSRERAAVAALFRLRERLIATKSSTTLLKKVANAFKFAGRNPMIIGNLLRKNPASAEFVISGESVNLTIIARNALTDKAPRIKPRIAPPSLSIQPSIIALRIDLNAKAIRAATPS